MDTDDAADIISELPEEMKGEVISELEDFEHAKDIVELLRYDEDTAGGLMAKEYIQANENWNVLTCIQEIRKQAENVSRVRSEEHTSELQSRPHLVCRLLLEK